MALDLHVLEHEIRQGRISLDNFSAGRLVAECLSSGSIVLNSEKKAYEIEFNSEFIVETKKLLLAKGSKNWKRIQDDVFARENQAFELKKGNRRSSRIILRPNELEKISEYAVPVKAEKSLIALSREAKEYTYSAISLLCSIFNASSLNLPAVELNPNLKSRYNPRKNKITLSTVMPEIIYGNAGRFICERNMAPIIEKSELGLFFAMAIKESIITFCSRIGNANAPIPDNGESEEFLLVSRLMKHDVNYYKARNAGKGNIKDNLLQKVLAYAHNKKNRFSLSKKLGYAFGSALFYSDSLVTAKQFLLEKERNSINDFFEAKCFINRMETLHNNIKNGVTLK